MPSIPTVPTRNMARVNQARDKTRAKVALRKAVKMVNFWDTVPPTPRSISAWFVDQAAAKAYLAEHNTAEDLVAVAKVLKLGEWAADLTFYGY